MKKILLLLILFALTLSAYSQHRFPNPIYKMTKDNPFYGSTYFYQERINTTGMSIKRYDRYSVLNESVYVINKSKDGLIDTLRSKSDPSFIEYLTYLPNGKPASYKRELAYGNEDEYYTSDEMGRLTNVMLERNKIEYSYSSEQATSISYRLDYNDNWGPLTKTIITYTDEGFISNDYYYLLEDKFEDEPSWTLIYRFDSEGRLKEYEYENGNLIAFEYTEDGYSKIDYHGYSRKPYSKEDHLFNETNNILKYSIYFWRNEKWSLDYTGEYTYYNDPTSNTEINESVKVYGSDGLFMIESDIPTSASIYSTSGSLMKQININTGINQIPMTSGIYIVSVDGKSYKVLVK